MHRFLKRITRWLNNKKKLDSAEYWENRYRDGKTSGRGSYRRLAEFKATIINAFVSENDIETVIEFGRGDGNQLNQYRFDSYLGLDVSKTVIKTCRELFVEDSSKHFKLISELNDESADLTMSIDVIYHLVEDIVFENHLETLFNASNKYVIIYSSNEDIYDPNIPHVKHRNFTKIIEDQHTEFSLLTHIPNKYPFNPNEEQTSRADFFIYLKNL